MRNIRLAARMLLKTPFVTAVAVLSLALGIGANAAIFSMFDQLLLRPLPVPAAESLVNLAAPGPKPGHVSASNSGDVTEVFSYAMYRDLEKSPDMPINVAGHRISGVSLSIHDEPMTGQAGIVSGSYFPVLGLTPARGRLLIPADDRGIGGNFVAVISYRFWQVKLGGASDVVGQQIVVNGKPYTIVGIAPQGFEGTTVGLHLDVFVPLSMQGELQGFKGWEDRRNYWVYVFGRLKPGVSSSAASTATNGVYSAILNGVEAPLQQNMSDQTMAKFRAKQVLLTPGARGQSNISTFAKTPILLLFCVTGVVLLIACANIANLLLARGAGRAMEMGIRLAIGASRSSLVTQLLTESILLAALGGLGSLLVAQWTLHVIASLLPSNASDIMTFTISWPLIVFSAALALATGLVFGLFPALHSTRRDLITSIRAGAGQLAGGRTAARFRNGLVTAQIALSMGLLIMSALFLRSLVNVSRVDLGVNIEHVATFNVLPSRTGYDSARSALLFNRMEQEIAAAPGVTAVTEDVVPLLGGNDWGNNVHVQDFHCGPDTDCSSLYNKIGADYFRSFGVKLIAGREFGSSDVTGAQRVAIVNAAFAKKFGLGQGSEVIGKFMGDEANDSLNVQIIGLVGNVKYNQVKDSVPAVFYRPWRQDARIGALNFYVKSTLPPENMLAGIRSMVARIDPRLPVQDLKTMTQQVNDNVRLDTMISTLSTAFALLATLLAGVGLYGVLSYSVAQRTREIGVRMALGADASEVRLLVMRQVATMLAIGATIGIGAALALGRAARSMLFELTPQDPTAIVVSVLLLAAVAALAGLLPARKAARTDPMLALRYD